MSFSARNMPLDPAARLKETEINSPQTPKSARSAPFDDNEKADPEQDDAGDDSDDAEFEDASEDLKPNVEADASPTEARGQRIKLDKKEIKALLAESEKNIHEEIAGVEQAVDLFLNSRFKEAETFLLQKYGRSLYYTLGYAVIVYLKSIMTFDPVDVEAAMDALKTTVEMASVFRKETGLVASFTGMVMRGKEGAAMKNMTTLQRHAELVFAEAHMLKAVLSLVTDTNMVAFVREGLNIRTAYNIYKSCYRFLQRIYDEEGGPEGLVKNGIDEHFVSGVLLGVGGFNLTLSMLPGKVLKLFELIGFSGDRDFGLSRLEIGGKWEVHDRSAVLNFKGSGKHKKESSKKSADKSGHERQDSLPVEDMIRVPFAMPASKSRTGGLRKFLCDLVLLSYHIVLSSAVQLPDCDLAFARQILDKSLKKYPDSFLFLYLYGRLAQTEGHPAQAIDQYNKVRGLQADWKQLVHICIWDSGLCTSALGDWKASEKCYETLFAESRWSKAIYRYMQGVMLYASDPINNRERAANIFKEVSKLTKKIAGKSIPMEKYVSRKSRKFALQGNRLLLPHYEILYIWNGFDVIPKETVPSFLAELDATLQDLESQLKAANGGVDAADQDEELLPYNTFYDDLCLARFLKGVLTRELAIPSVETLLPVTELAKRPRPTDPSVSTKISYAARQLEYVVQQADKIHLDHWILPFTRLELGKLYTRSGEYTKARREFNAALEGGYADDEVGKPTGKKASLENTLHFRTHNALVKLEVLERLVDEAT